ncbi:uncharacterized protein AMSG_02320 [Thecamonas trahens ATCC 50062]|uniref:C2H2-type domain-containing protein n=1 Tax=Thecamonas trahens ATCC 50062 TaxID=461836 RepID=A0A0L0DVK6_THETB|nr:hypothetical protein AMSG_02320 [Thecamonas trahens ATCC 50062]KNC56349.1 hypothetical protein AMSG_02320 [Thecamonas trahens ATCC 50062]|eukprot:XP_013760866.1 hypothetical protein AMSG_02320 [Thecamonas trahens ATCC 50062]
MKNNSNPRTVAADALAADAADGVAGCSDACTAEPSLADVKEFVKNLLEKKVSLEITIQEAMRFSNKYGQNLVTSIVRSWFRTSCRHRCLSCPNEFDKKRDLVAHVRESKHHKGVKQRIKAEKKANMAEFHKRVDGKTPCEYSDAELATLVNILLPTAFLEELFRRSRAV